MFLTLLKYLSKKPVIPSAIFFLFVITLTIIIALSCFKKLSKNHIEEKFAQTERLWETLLLSQKENMEIYFNFLLNNKKIKELMKRAVNSDEEGKKTVRGELFTTIFPLYDNLRKIGQIRQIQFFTPDNRSFLRMHAPHEYGDDLSKARPTVVYVNMHKKSVMGFDPGYYLSGFRYVFPIFDEEGDYIGGVEISKPFYDLKRALIDINQEFEYKLLIRQDIVKSRVAPHRQSIYQPSAFGNSWLEEDPLGELADSPPMLNPTLQAVYFELPKNLQVWEIINSPKGGVTTISFKGKFYMITVIKIYDIDGREVAALLGIGHSKFLDDLEEIKFIVINSIFLLSILASAIFLLNLYSVNRTLIEKEKVEKLIENSQRAGVILDKNGRIIYSNRKFQDLLGYKEDEILRQDFHDILHGHALAKEECPIYGAIMQGKELTVVEKVHSSTGEDFNLEITVLPFFGQGKNSGSIVLIKKL